MNHFTAKIEVNQSGSQQKREGCTINHASILKCDASNMPHKAGIMPLYAGLAKHNASILS